MSDYTVGDTVHFMFTTRRFSTGAPFTLGGTPVVSAYENESLTQITAGVTLGVDHDTVTGLNLVTVVASGANGFESGKDYHLVITTGTVDSVSVVGEVVGRFTLSRSAAAVDLANGTDGLGAIKTDTAAILADTGTDGVVVAAGSKTGYTLTATTGLGNQTADITGSLSGSVGSVTGAVGSVTGAVGSVTGNVGGNVAGSVGSVTAAVAITSNIKANQALAGFEFLMTDSTNHAPATGLTVTVVRSIDGGAFGAGTLSAVTEISDGIYSVDFGAGDLNGKVITLQASAAGADVTFERIVTQA